MSRSSRWWLLPYHIAVGATLFGLPGLRLGIPVWTMSLTHRGVFGGLVAAYLIAGLVLAFRPSARWRDALLLGLSAFGVVTIALQGADLEFPRAAFFAVIGAGLLALVVAVALTRFLAALTVLAALSAVAVLLLPVRVRIELRPDVPSTVSYDSVTTALYPLAVARYKNVVPAGRKFEAFGAIVEFDDGYLVATGDGALFTVRIPASGSAQVSRLPTQVPLNIDAFDRATDRNGAGQYFRLMDLRIREQDGRLQVFASHHWWDDARHCSVVQVSELETTPAALATARLDDQWKTLYQSTPCLPLAHTDWPFSGMEGGGRIRLVDDSTLLLTIGDHGFNDVVYSPDYVSDTAASYGKTWKIHLGGRRRPELFTIGHRNPQGLFIDPDGQIWETEHGPQGGDELNLLRPGLNYGWPHVTYGTDYGLFTWPRNAVQGEHAGYTLPIYAWVPSIGTSNLIRLRGDLFPLWKGDLLVASLVGAKLFRMHLDGDRVVFAEPIPIGDRIRDLLEDRKGRLVLWTDSRSLIVITPAPFPPVKDRPPARTIGALP